MFISLPQEKQYRCFYPTHPTGRFYNEDGVRNAADNVYLQPAVDQYTSIDVIVKPNMLFQVITSQKRPCNLEALQNVANLLTPQNLQLFLWYHRNSFAPTNIKRI